MQDVLSYILEGLMSVSNSKKNFIHPELKEGEIFLCNAEEQGIEFLREKWKSLRTGIFCFTINGVPVETGVPCFVNDKEYSDKKIHK